MNRMPSLFVSHGAPTFAIEPALAGPLLRQLGRELPRPKAVLVFSPHWMTPGVRVSSTATPETVHDFGGFPAELYRIQYPAPGSPEVAARALELLNAAGWNATADERARPRPRRMGARCVTCSPMPTCRCCRCRCRATWTRRVPCGWAVRWRRWPMKACCCSARAASRTTCTSSGRTSALPARPMPREFVEWARSAVQHHDEAGLVNYLAVAPHAQRAHPTPDHYLPLPFAFGAAAPDAPVRVLDGGMTYGVLAMDAYLFGETKGANA